MNSAPSASIGPPAARAASLRLASLTGLWLPDLPVAPSPTVTGAESNPVTMWLPTASGTDDPHERRADPLGGSEPVPDPRGDPCRARAGTEHREPTRSVRLGPGPARTAGLRPRPAR